MSDLNEGWALCDDSGVFRAPLSFPGDGITALLEAGLIPDPYWGRNEYDLRWIADRDWTAMRTFTLDHPDSTLVLDGLDTIVDVSINGQPVLSARNAFRTYRVDLNGIAEPGENQIELRFRSSVKHAAALQQEQPYFVPFNGDNCPIPNGNMLRKVQCDFGWDWNIALAPFGVLGGIYVEQNSPVRIDAVLIDQTHQNGAVDVTVDVELDCAVGGAFEYSFSLCGQTFAGAARVQSGQSRVTETLHIENPVLWWPAGQGDQVLHDLEIQVGDAQATRRIGLRDIALIVEDDAAGTGFRFNVNGRDVFAKGANWIPADALCGRITKSGVADLLQSAVDANMNMIRVWGGGRYEPTWFYDMCDELGLMVWQDFMFACMMYPSTETFLAEVAAEVAENVRRMNHHAALAVWCGDNELIGALTWFKETRENRDLYLVAYDRLNRTIETALKAVSPSANWWPSSPSPGYMNFGDAWHDDSSGDMHFWSVWHEGRDFEHYRDVNPRFCSEFGFQSYPSLDVIRSFVAPEDMNIAAPVFESHQKNAGGNARIAETMFRYFRFPVDFENFVYLSQVQQGLAIKTAVSYWRSLKPHCMGTLYWQLNDTWPVASWSSLDYGGGWKVLHYMARDFFAPVVATAVPKGSDIKIKIISDLTDEADVSVKVFALSLNGAERPLGSVRSIIHPDQSAEVFSIVQEALEPDELLGFEWVCADGTSGSDVYAPKPYKAYPLSSPHLETTLTETEFGYDIVLSAQSLALFVALESDIPGRFSANCLTVRPGHDIKVSFIPKTSDKKPNFTVRDLYSATYGAQT